MNGLAWLFVIIVAYPVIGFAACGVCRFLKVFNGLSDIDRKEFRLSLFFAWPFIVIELIMALLLSGLLYIEGSIDKIVHKAAGNKNQNGRNSTQSGGHQS